MANTSEDVKVFVSALYKKKSVIIGVFNAYINWNHTV